jgi:hypothetical protein
MKIAIYSDLHNEFEPFDLDPALLSSVDLVVLAGDIGPRHRGVEWTKTWANAIPSTPVLMIAGNHEFYGGHFDKVIGEMREAANGTNIRILENDQVVIDDVRFLGCTLWTDFKLYEAQHTSPLVTINTIAAFMNDYQKVTAYGREAGTYRKLHPRDTLRRHEVSRDWLKSRLAEPFAGPTVVITHHAPSPKSVPEAFEGDVLSAAYATDLESMMGRHVPLWIHGHIHNTIDYTVYGTRVLCNPRGYAPKHLNKSFNPSLVVSVEPGGQSVG